MDVQNIKSLIFMIYNKLFPLLIFSRETHTEMAITEGALSDKRG